LGIPAFGFGEALGYSDRQPVPFYAGEGLIKGPGLDSVFTYLWHGRTGTAPEVLAMIGHEAGLPCLLGLIIVLALLFFSLARLAMQIGNRAGAAMAWGLIVFLAAQCLLAVETLIPVGVPIGEGPPLLSGGWADYLADLIAIGIVIGLSRRAGSPMRATMPVQTHPQLSQAATPA
jgi:cell division protein FtsW (lipid II flippase)